MTEEQFFAYISDSGKVQSAAEPALNELCMQYAVKWGGLYTEEDMYGVASMKEKEVYADALAGISRAKTRGTKKITSAVRKVFYKHTGLDIDALLADEQSTATEAKQNEVQSAVTEPKAQAPPNKAQYSAETDFSRDKYFDRQIDKWDEKPDGTRIKVGVLNKGSALNKVGFPAEGMWFDVGKIKKSFGKHGDHLTKTVLKEIPNLLNDPIAITEYRGPEGNIDNTVNVFGMFMPDGKTPIVVGVMMTKARNGSTIINKIRTIHAHGNAEINDNNILYLNEDKKRTRNWFQVCDNSVPLEGTKFGLIRSISYTDTKSQDRIQQKEKVNSYSVDEDLPINLQLILNGDFDSKRNELHIGTTSNFLTEQIGAEALDLYMPAEKAYRAMATEGKAIRDGKPVGKNINYHGLGKNGLIEILNASENPIAAFADTPSKNNKRENRIVLVTDVKADGGLGVVIEEMDTLARTGGKQVRANKSITVYPKSDALNAISDAAASGRILYIDKKRSHVLHSGRKGSNYPTTISEADFSNNIRSFWDNVKWKKSGKTEMSFDSNTKAEPEWKKKLREYNTEDSYSVDDAVTTEEEAQHRRDFQKIVTGESLRKLNERKTKLEGVIEGYKRIDELADYQTKKLAQLEGDLAAVNSEIEKKTKKAEERKADRKTAAEAAAEAAASAVDSLNIRRITEQSRRVLRQQIYDQYGILRWRKDIGATIDAFAEKWITKKKITKKDIESFEDALMQSGAIRVESAKLRHTRGIHAGNVLRRRRKAFVRHRRLLGT